MDGNNRNFFKKRPNIQFKKKGGNKKGKWNNSSHEQSSGNSQSVDTVYRILCPSRKIGGVIGKGGSIVKALREETQAKITVADSVPGADERVIIIYSSPNKLSRNQNDDEDSAGESELEPMEPHCAAQDALLKVNDRIIEEELFGGMTFDDDNENNVVTIRLLVPNFMVGCLLGKRGDVIQRLRSETGASIRVLPADHLPTCAMSTDELVQVIFLLFDSLISYIRALLLAYEMNFLHQNCIVSMPFKWVGIQSLVEGYDYPYLPYKDTTLLGRLSWFEFTKNALFLFFFIFNLNWRGLA